MGIYLRPLVKEDAYISHHWRNNPKIWKYTGSRPDKFISADIELTWIEKVLLRANEKRFAICIENSEQYIGNVQLTNIESDTAIFHIFIGETKYWGKGYGTIATKKIIEYAFNILKLKEIELEVNQYNKVAIKAYKRVGFKNYSIKDGNMVMKVTEKKYNFQ